MHTVNNLSVLINPLLAWSGWLPDEGIHLLQAISAVSSETTHPLLLAPHTNSLKTPQRFLSHPDGKPRRGFRARSGGDARLGRRRL
jgi:hypothetical protein